MATTIVAAYVDGRNVFIINIGDSRAYLLRNGKLYQITEDHTYVNTLIKAGLISEEDALTHENRNMITRAVGADDQIEADFFTFTVRVDDIVLLCTDGLYDEVPEDELIERLIKRGKDSGRSDDNLETIKKRLDVYHNQTSPLKEYYEQEGIYAAIHGSGSVEGIFEDIKSAIAKVK